MWAWEQHAVFFEFSYILDGDFVFPAPSVSQCPTAVGGPGPGAIVHVRSQTQGWIFLQEI